MKLEDMLVKEFQEATVNYNKQLMAIIKKYNQKVDSKKIIVEYSTCFCTLQHAHMRFIDEATEICIEDYYDQMKSSLALCYRLIKKIQ